MVVHGRRTRIYSITLAGTIAFFLGFYRLVAIAIYGFQPEPYVVINHFSAILAMWLVGGWGLYYARFHNKSVRMSSEFKTMRYISLAASIMCWLRFISAIFYFWQRFDTTSHVVTITYVLFDLLLWAALGVFFFSYWLRSQNKSGSSGHHHHSSHSTKSSHEHHHEHSEGLEQHHHHHHTEEA